MATEFHDDFAAEQEGDTDLVKTLRKQIAAHAAARKAAETEAQTLKTQVRESQVKGLLSGFPEEVLEYVPETVTDEASLNEWLEGKGKIFAKLRQTDTAESTTPSASTGDAGNDDGETEAGLSPELAALFAQVSATESGAQQPDASIEARLSAGLNSLKGAGPDAVAAAFQSGKIPIA